FLLDRIHRFSKAQQEGLLPAVEEGLVMLVGATTENPAFEVNGALLSRLRVYALRALSPREVGEVLGEAAARELSSTPVEQEAIDFLARRSEGDARTALNALELAAETAAELGEERVTLARAEDALQRRALLYDKRGDLHYDYISAWIKATRGSDPDASLYYLAVMLEGGEDPRFIVRRMVILASEDIGNADPGALSVATAAAQASLEIRDPARGEILGSVRATQPDRVPELVRAVAKVQPLWALLRVSDRARYMDRMAQAVIDDFDELARSIAREQGRPAAE